MGRKGKPKKQTTQNREVDTVERAHVRAQCISGEAFEFSLPKDREVRAVVNRIGKEWERPPVCLTLLFDGEAVSVSDSLATFCDSNDEANFAVVFNISALYKQVEQGDVESRLEAIGELWRFAEDGNVDLQMFTKAMCSSMEHKDKTVRETAAEALREVISKGDTFAVGRLSKHLRNSRPEVRHLAVAALGCVAEDGDVCVIHSILDLLRNDHSAEVQKEAISALEKLAEHGDDTVIAELKRLLNHQFRLLRKLAADALGSVACEGDEYVILALIERASEERSGPSDPNCAELACVDSIRKLAPVGHKDALTCFSQKMMRAVDPHTDTMCSLVKGISRLTREDDWHAVDLLERLYALWVSENTDEHTDVLKVRAVREAHSHLQHRIRKFKKPPIEERNPAVRVHQKNLGTSDELTEREQSPVEIAFLKMTFLCDKLRLLTDTDRWDATCQSEVAAEEVWEELDEMNRHIQSMCTD